MLHMAFDLTSIVWPADSQAQAAALLIAFVIFLALAYKIWHIATKAIVLAFLGGVFPFAVAYLGLNIPVTADFETALKFAGLAVGVFVLYEFWHFIVAFLKLVTYPIRVILRMEEHHKEDELKEEVKRLAKEKREQ